MLYTPFEWIEFTDQAIWDGLFFTFGGKAYAIFAFLFGFSFFTQEDNQSFIFGILFVLMPMAFTHRWLRHFKHGPFEGVWRGFTRIGNKK